MATTDLYSVAGDITKTRHALRFLGGAALTNEFSSRLSFGCGTVLVADTVRITMNERMGFAFVIQAA